MTENEQYLHDTISRLVRMGFQSPADIKADVLEQVEDEGLEEEISAAWISQLVDEQVAGLRAQSPSWPRPTDPERLAAAFAALARRRIIALHNAGYTTSDGEADVVEVELTLRENGIEPAGYCFYHQQDLERALNPRVRNLMLAFQKVNNEDEAVTVGVGQAVVKELRRQGFEVVWNGQASQKIEIKNVSWHKLYEEEDTRFDHSQPIRLMAGANPDQAGGFTAG